MLTDLKAKVKIILNRCGMFGEFYNDYKTYRKWNYHSPSVHTQCAQEAKILRQTHIIEKGLSLTSPRKGFGVPKIEELFKMLDEYLSLGFSVENVPFQNALNVVHEYVKFQQGLNYTNETINKKLESYEQYRDKSFTAGIEHTTYEDIKADALAQFPEFFNSRHSVRQFSDREIDVETIKKAVQLAQKAPSACNRQATKVYFYSAKEVNDQLGELIAGNTGFADEVKNYLVLTGDISAFYDTFERNQLYVEAGMFAMALIEALHYFGIGSCPLQNGEYKKKNEKFKKICGNIPENERIVIFIAIGYYKDEFSYAVSKRKNLEEVLKID